MSDVGERSSPAQSAKETRADRFAHATRRIIAGVAVAAVVYLITNPYIVINAFVNREVLRSNFGNSLAMYEIARIGEGFVRVLELTVEGATLPVLILGVLALFVAFARRGGICSRAASFSLRGGIEKGTPAAVEDSRGLKPAARDSSSHADSPLRVTILPLATPALVFFVQFVLIGAGKPAEYGRFGVFTNTALVIGSACLLTRRWIRLREIINWIPATFVLVWLAGSGLLYLAGFRADSVVGKWRLHGRAAPHGLTVDFRHRGDEGYWIGRNVAVVAEPAPYCFPPIPFENAQVLLFPDWAEAEQYWHENRFDTILVRTVDEVSIEHLRPGYGGFPPGWSIEYKLRCLFDPTTASCPDRETPISWAFKPTIVRPPELRAGP